MSEPERRCAECGKVTPPGSIHTCSPQVAPYVPAPGTRVTVGRKQWEAVDLGGYQPRWCEVEDLSHYHLWADEQWDMLTRIAELEAKIAEAQRTAQEVVLGGHARVCNQPACHAAIVRRESGQRVCAAGHPVRWVDVAELDEVTSDLAAFRALAKDAAGVSTSDRTPRTDGYRHLLVDQLAALDKETT